MSSLPKKVAVVVGGASGIGFATVQLLSSQPGWQIVIADIKEAEERANRLTDHGQITGEHVDVGSPAGVSSLFERIGEMYQRIDVLVNCAGIIGPIPSSQITDQSWESMLSIHLGGAMRCARAAFPLMSANGDAAMVLTSSVGAALGVPQRAAYCSAKGGIESLTRVLAVEWAPHGIRVNAVAPGFTRTALVAQSIEAGRVDVDAVVRRIPMARMAEPREIARAIRFLCSAEASYITGQVLVVDGGFLVNGNA